MHVPGATSIFCILGPSFTRWFFGHLFDLYPLERTSASYQRDLRPIVLQKGGEVWDQCTIISDL